MSNGLRDLVRALHRRRSGSDAGSSRGESPARIRAVLATVALLGYVRRNRRLRRGLSLVRTLPGFSGLYRRLDPLTVNPKFRRYRLEDLSPRAQSIYLDLSGIETPRGAK